MLGGTWGLERLQRSLRGRQRRGHKPRSQVLGCSLASPPLPAGGLEQVTPVCEAKGLSESPARANSLRGPGRSPSTATHSCAAQTLAAWVWGAAEGAQEPCLLQQHGGAPSWPGVASVRLQGQTLSCLLALLFGSQPLAWKWAHRVKGSLGSCWFPTSTPDLLGKGQPGRCRFQRLRKPLWEECGANAGEQAALCPGSVLAHTCQRLCSPWRNTVLQVGVCTASTLRARDPYSRQNSLVPPGSHFRAGRMFPPKQNRI